MFLSQSYLYKGERKQNKANKTYNLKSLKTALLLLLTKNAVLNNDISIKALQSYLEKN